MSEEQITIGLPYEEIKNVVSRDKLRTLAIANNGRGGRQTWYIDFDVMEIRPVFNVRQDYGDLVSLANYMRANGTDGMEPFTVDVVVVDDQVKVYVEMGHRRTKAMEILKKDGTLYTIDKPGLRLGKVECFVNNSEVDELTRLRRQYSSNKTKEYTTIEMAELCFRMKTYFNLSPKEIAIDLGISRQHVENYIILAGETDQVKQAVNKGSIKMTTAVSLVRTVKDSNERNDIISQAVASGSPVTATEVKKILGERNAGEDNGDKEPRQKKDPNAPVEYDETREEIREAQNVIKLLDKLNANISKLPNKEQFIADMDKLVGYAQKSMVFVRDWIHKNKKHNKRDR